MGGREKVLTLIKFMGDQNCNSKSSVLRVRLLVVVTQFGPDVMGHFIQIRINLRCTETTSYV